MIRVVPGKAAERALSRNPGAMAARLMNSLTSGPTVRPKLAVEIHSRRTFESNCRALNRGLGPNRPWIRLRVNLNSIAVDVSQREDHRARAPESRIFGRKHTN